MNNIKKQITARKNSISYALKGISNIINSEVNARIHMASTIAVVVAGVICELSIEKWMAIAFAIAIVWIAETINTAVEKLCNLVVDNKYHPKVKVIKDISAGAVLISAVLSVVIAVLVFLK